MLIEVSEIRKRIAVLLPYQVDAASHLGAWGRETREWCDAEVGERAITEVPGPLTYKDQERKYFLNVHGSWWVWGAVYYFKQEEYAMLFKLRWIG